MGTVSGTLSKYPDAAVVWVDAHADINTVTSTPSGNIHDMPVPFLMGPPSTEMVPEFSWIQPGILKPHQIIYIGLRDVDVGEKRVMKENGIKAFSMHEVDKYGIGKVWRINTSLFILHYRATTYILNSKRGTYETITAH